MDLLTILSALAASTVIATALIKLLLWAKKKRIRKREGVCDDIELWDVTVYRNTPEKESIIIARLAVKAKSRDEAIYRGRFLIEDWNNIKLGFALPLGQDLPVDDEINDIRFVRPDLLPQNDGEQVALSANAEKRN